jgi:GT2 family glycosyltransferase
LGNVSVIIVSWNARGYLRECLASIRRTGGNVVKEVIVVDNASTDGSPEMVAAEFPEVNLIRAGQNLGFARANNLGLQAARGDYLALVNSDVVVHPGCFQTLTGFLEAHPRAGLAGPRVIGRDGQPQRTCRRLPGVWNTVCETFGLDTALARCPWFSGREMRHWKQDRTAQVPVLSGCFWLARRAAVEQVGGLDERFFFYAEDVDWCRRFRQAGWQTWYVFEAGATHFGGGSSANAPARYCVEMLRANLTYWEKYHGAPGRRLYYLLLVVYHGWRFALRALLNGIGAGESGDFQSRYRENRVCLKWLLTGRGPERETNPALTDNALTCTKA